jgi:hypothetical protein
MKLSGSASQARKRLADGQQIALPVSLDGWTLTSSIDFVTITKPFRPDLYQLKKALLDPSLTDRTNVKVPPEKRGERDVLTIHDPTLGQLQRLIDIDPAARIYEIEFSIDFRPGGPDPASDDELVPVFRWLADAIRPAELKATRRHWDDSVGRKGDYVPTSGGPSISVSTHLWRDRLERIKQRLYLKTLDQGRPVERPSVRLEATLSMTACSDVNLAAAWQLATFGPDLRRTLAPCFQVAAGIKPKLKRVRHVEGTTIAQKTEAANAKEVLKVEQAWMRQGAMWAVMNGYAIVPDKVVHKRIGDALRRLGEHLARLKLPENSRAHVSSESAGTVTELEFEDWTTELPIGKAHKYPSIRKKPTQHKKGEG